MPEPTSPLQSFMEQRPHLVGLAYRMLGDLQRAEDIVQDAWVRMQGRHGEPLRDARPFLVKVVTRLCLNELGSARARREWTRGDRLPEPVFVGTGGLLDVETLDQVSMAFLVLLQRLTAAERATLLLHDVFDFEHGEVAELIGKTPAASRQLLKRAREQVAAERRNLETSPEAHRRALHAFLRAAQAGDRQELRELLQEDALLIVDAGPSGRSFGGARNLPGPLVGADKVAAFIAAVTGRGAEGLTYRECDLNRQPGVVALQDGAAHSVIMLALRDDRIAAIFIHADPARLHHVG